MNLVRESVRLVMQEHIEAELIGVERYERSATPGGRAFVGTEGPAAFTGSTRQGSFGCAWGVGGQAVAVAGGPVVVYTDFASTTQSCLGAHAKRSHARPPAPKSTGLHHYAVRISASIPRSASMPLQSSSGLWVRSLHGSRIGDPLLHTCQG